MSPPIRILGIDATKDPDELPRACTVDPEAPSRPLVAHEWLVTNGLGGYAAGTVSGVITRRFHGVLVAALPAPRGRTMMLNHLGERVMLGARTMRICGQEDPHRRDEPIARCTDFRIEMGLPVWRYEIADCVIERRVVMPHRQNTTFVVYTLCSGSSEPEIELEPWLHFRHHEGSVEGRVEGEYSLKLIGDRFEVSQEDHADVPPLRMQVRGCESAFRIEGKRIHDVRYHIEASRGYDAVGALYTPGFFRARLRRGEPIALVASVEDWNVVHAVPHDQVVARERERRAKLAALAHPKAREGLAAELVQAADQFLITPAGRTEDAARAHASGDEIRTVIAGYHWFTDWGRDTMISLEGLTLTTGRHNEAGYILRTFAHYVRDGLIPNMFPEGKNDGLYHTADATLWFFHALQRYVEVTQDRVTLRLLMPTLMDIVAHHMRGTRFGIGVDPDDGLLRQGAEGYQLTWMDAKVGDYVVTPRRGKAVEINALWYNALRCMQRWALDELRDEGTARHFAEHADRAFASFNARFWCSQGGYLYDLIDGEGGDDPAFRPNQIFAFSLAHPVLEKSKWETVLHKVQTRLLTPFGLRSLAPGHADYKPRYFGDLRARDLAYHQGTVWAWLIGPFVDAFLRVHPERVAEARSLLSGFGSAMNDACVGNISEIFDAEEPYVPRGCCAQAWSVAEVLRALVKTAT
ncbi:amylo-alpha-1,6-glucosidase [Sandaracinus amylolyticus]|uniref:Glycogen debranching enzyme n=1 Tax=Sandaracinus amylolyticus TaxID=927083 RepID=A0A0F6YLV2_9BACT|nr:amylo-alpha-1,6-glucosidase [Sandaracinus amylolyticus]AKF09635.1 glycogen debranching enzyme [Sandaracinus amylolyticus]